MYLRRVTLDICNKDLWPLLLTSVLCTSKLYLERIPCMFDNSCAASGTCDAEINKKKKLKQCIMQNHRKRLILNMTNITDIVTEIQLYYVHLALSVNQESK